MITMSPCNLVWFSQNQIRYKFGTVGMEKLMKKMNFNKNHNAIWIENKNCNNINLKVVNLLPFTITKKNVFPTNTHGTWSVGETVWECKREVVSIFKLNNIRKIRIRYFRYRIRTYGTCMPVWCHIRIIFLWKRWFTIKRNQRVQNIQLRKCYTPSQRVYAWTLANHGMVYGVTTNECCLRKYWWIALTNLKNSRCRMKIKKSRLINVYYLLTAIEKKE